MKFDTDVKLVQSHKADAWAATTNTSAAIDCTGFDTARIIVNCGTCTATGTLNIKVQSSTTSGGSYADVSGAAFPAITTANDEQIHVGILHVNELAAKPFIKVVAVGATDACDYGIVVELFNGRESSANTTTLAFNT